jgi:hypothetical protein
LRESGQFTLGRPAIVAGLVALILAVAAVAWWGIAQGTAQPTKADYARFDIERALLDTSMNAYDPLLAAYTSEYTNAYIEERSGDETNPIRTHHEDILKDESALARARLERMKASVVLKDQAIAQPFDEFYKSYQAVVDYYDQYADSVSRITESVAGPCSQMSKLNVARASFASEYTKAADRCLDALATAKEGSDKDTSDLLTAVEKMVRERRSKLQATIGKEGAEFSATQMIALTSLLQTNNEVEKAQNAYSSAVQATYKKVVDDANRANKALAGALSEHVDTVSTPTEDEQ